MKRQAPALSAGRHARRHFCARARQPALQPKQRSVGNHHNDSDGGDSDSDRDSDDGATHVVDKATVRGLAEHMRPEQREVHALELEKHALERELAHVRATKAASIAAFVALGAAKAGQYLDQRGGAQVQKPVDARHRSR